MLYNLSALHRFQGNYYEAGLVLEQLLSSCEVSKFEDRGMEGNQIPGPNLVNECPDTTEVRFALADTYDSLGRFVEAQKLFNTILLERRKLLGEDHPSTLETVRRLKINAQLQGNKPQRVRQGDKVLFKQAKTFPIARNSKRLPVPYLVLWCCMHEKWYRKIDRTGIQEEDLNFDMAGRERAYSI